MCNCSWCNMFADLSGWKPSDQGMCLRVLFDKLVQDIEMKVRGT